MPVNAVQFAAAPSAGKPPTNALSCLAPRAAASNRAKRGYIIRLDVGPPPRAIQSNQRNHLEILTTQAGGLINVNIFKIL